MPYTTTGIFGKSSNVGTLMLAQRLGPERYADMLRKFGLGQRTGVGLPGESAGLVPPIDQWSGSTFANLPIGQGLSMTLLQMTGMYQAIANDGVRIPPRIIKTTIAPDGTRTDEPRPEGVRVVSPQTAQTVRQMLRATVQRDPMGDQQGTGPQAAVEGYQISGKTGTAQQINPGCGCYYDDVYWITFAGIATTDDPALRRRRDDGQPAPHGRRPARHDGGAAVPQHRRPGCCSGRTCRCRPTQVRRSRCKPTEPSRAAAAGRPVLCHRHEPASQPSCRPRARAAGRAGGARCPPGSARCRTSGSPG